MSNKPHAKTTRNDTIQQIHHYIILTLEYMDWTLLNSCTLLISNLQFYSQSKLFVLLDYKFVRLLANVIIIIINITKPIVNSIKIGLNCI